MVWETPETVAVITIHGECPLQFVAMNKLGLLPSKLSWNNPRAGDEAYLLKITESSTNAQYYYPLIPSIFIDFWVVPYRLPKYVSTDYGT